MKKRLTKSKGIKGIIIIRYLYLLAGITVFSLPAQAQDPDSIVIISYVRKAEHRDRITTEELAKFKTSSPPSKTSVDTDSVVDKLKNKLEQKIEPTRDVLIWQKRQELRTNNAITASIGTANMYDTYLSPLEYKGFSIHLMYEQMRRTTWFDYRFYKQQVFQLDLAKGDNPAKNASEYWALFNYRIGGHYMLYTTDKFRLGVGGLWDINAGVLYNERNGNNPASARGYSNLNLSATASYKFSWGAIRWQMDSPLMGILFSPKYGQSYYEISLGNSVGLVNFASFHNQRALRNYITADIPLGQYIIRVGYMGSWYQTKVNDIQTHHYTNSFVIGFPIEGVKRPREKTKNQYWDGY